MPLFSKSLMVLSSWLQNENTGKAGREAWSGTWMGESGCGERQHQTKALRLTHHSKHVPQPSINMQHTVA
jgi:hypothetical protein